MISRRKILSRSQCDLDFSQNIYGGGDVWFSESKLFQDHIHEVLAKYNQLDDEIWAKIIVMERNKRVAKAYARASAISVNGSHAGFDGYRIGLNGFDVSSDSRVEDIKKMIGKGIKMKMDDSGNILIKKVSRCNVIIRSHRKVPSGVPTSTGGADDSTAVSSEILNAKGRLEAEKALKLFDMKKFSTNVDKELRNSYPDRQKLEKQCITVVAFVKDAPEIIEIPCYIMIINIVAIDMLKSRVPSGSDARSTALSSRFGPSSGETFDAEDDDEDDDVNGSKWDMHDVYSKTDEDYSLSKPDSSSGGSSGGSRGALIYHRKKQQLLLNNRHRRSINPVIHHQVSQYPPVPSLHPTSSSSSSLSPLSSSKLPPKLPPRDFSGKFRPEPLPDYTDDDDDPVLPNGNRHDVNDDDDAAPDENNSPQRIYFRSKSSGSRGNRYMMNGINMNRQNGIRSRGNFQKTGLERVDFGQRTQPNYFHYFQ